MSVSVLTVDDEADVADGNISDARCGRANTCCISPALAKVRSTSSPGV
jgi:hypothetical protein